MQPTQTVSFQCGHCRKVMGVSTAYLGKQVRCPHCQQVVLAPAQAPAPAPVPAGAAPRPPSGPSFQTPAGPSKDEHESIFGEHIDEDLFGSTPKSKVELPPEPARPNNMQLEPTVFNVPGLPESPGLLPPTIPSNSAAPMPATAGTTAVATAPSDWADGAAPAVSGVPTVQPAVRPLVTGNMIPIYILAFVIPYALVMTFLAIKYYLDYRSAPNPLEMLPDPGEPKSKSDSKSQTIRRVVPTTTLPPHLIAELGKTIHLGDLEVTPQKVEQKRLTFRVRGQDPKDPNARRDRPEEESLALHLNFKNVSKKTLFRPTDSVFDYFWRDKTDPESVMPYTFVTVNGIRYTGPFPRNLKGNTVRSNDNLRLDFVEGQEGDSKILAPGETSSTVIVTEPKDQVPSMLRSHKGKLLWRVQLRRGLVKVGDKDVSATAIIGVEFDKDQIQKVDK
jgi:DNA-directed RNA polymerase subunit RPC12/RpoP